MSTARNLIVTPLGSIIFLLAIMATASARDAPSTATPPADHEAVSGVGGGAATDVEGNHTMPATVVATDPKTGIVDVTSEGMALKMHFPAPSIAKLKVGDKITLHLGFTRP